MIQRSHTQALLFVLWTAVCVSACGEVSDNDVGSGADDEDSSDAASSGGSGEDDGGSNGGAEGGARNSDGGASGIGGSGASLFATGGQGLGGDASCEGDCGPELLGGAGGECEGDGCELDTRPVTEMSSLSGGTFLMGAEDLHMASPVHERMVAPFSIDRTEVTAGAYDACIAAGACSPVESDGGLGQNSGSAEFSEYPVNYVSFEQAEEFCQWMGKRLPTETEWEYAAGGALGYRYPWGNDDPAWQACTAAASGVGDNPSPIEDLEYDYDHGCKVGEFPPEAHGLFDMAGGVREFVDAPWCEYSSETESGYSEENNSLITCMEGPVLRGFGFTSSVVPDGVRVSYRESGNALLTRGHQGVGFRCAKSD